VEKFPTTDSATSKDFLSSKSTAFEEYYDNIQEHLQLLSGMDELLTGKSEEVLNFCKIPELFRNAQQESWSGATLGSRSQYALYRGH